MKALFTTLKDQKGKKQSTIVVYQIDKDTNRGCTWSSVACKLSSESIGNMKLIAQKKLTNAVLGFVLLQIFIKFSQPESA